MGMVRLTGGFAAGMLDGGGWPDVAEDAFYDRAQQYVQVLRQVTDVLDTLRQQRSEIFVSGLWSGMAAGAANGALDSSIDELVNLQTDLTIRTSATTWMPRTGRSL